ncbi:IspA Geranylgeranyl pyrophosphate synthase [Rhabdaerophilaceae bacterium]
MEEAFQQRLGHVAAAVESVLDTHLAARGRPPRLVAAMRHAVFAGGKRLRPYLVIESARLFGQEGEGPLRVAAALEALHCYSLVHDDLPAMDDDDVRRGQPTVHKAYDEATAILAGDALLTIAFSILSDRRTSPSALRRIRLVSALSTAAGLDGMVGGQMLDLDAEGRFSGGKARRLGLRAIHRLQAMKTGALIRFAAEAGGMLAPRVQTGQKRALRNFGEALGFAFQIRDDLLDVEGEAVIVGKAIAKDAKAGKATLVSLMGLEGARNELQRVTETACSELHSVFGPASDPLVAVLHFNQNRVK